MSSSVPSEQHEALARMIAEHLDGPTDVDPIEADYEFARRVLAWLDSEGYIKTEWEYGWCFADQDPARYGETFGGLTLEGAQDFLTDFTVPTSLLRRRHYEGPWEVIPDAAA